MIYTVECSFADANSEAEWNDFYSLEKLPALISVTGFHTSQRFKSLSDGCPVYLAVHTIDGLDVLTERNIARKAVAILRGGSNTSPTGIEISTAISALRRRSMLTNSSCFVQAAPNL